MRPASAPSVPVRRSRHGSCDHCFALRGNGHRQHRPSLDRPLSRAMTVRLTSGPIPLNALSDQIMHANAAIIGVGQSAYTRRPQPGQSKHTFIRDAVVAALADAEIDPRAIDGMAGAPFSLAPDAAVDLAWKLGLALLLLRHDTDRWSFRRKTPGDAPA